MEKAHRVLLRARAAMFGCHEPAWKIAGCLAAREALESMGMPRL